MLSKLKILKQCSCSVKYFSNYSAKLLLSPENKKKCMERFHSMSIKQGMKETKKSAAVLVPIIVDGDTMSLLYTLRAAQMKTHRGQVSFPGGMKDQSDKNCVETALRETEEELGILKNRIEIWGQGQPIVRQDMSIVPVIGQIDLNINEENLKINKHEVDQIFAIPLEDLCDIKNLKHTQFRGTFSTPTYFGGPYRIWGLTAVITFMFLKALLPHKLYPHHIAYIPDIAPIIKNEFQL